MTDEKLRTLIAQALMISVSQVTPDLAMQKSEAWDSLKHMELIVALEAACGFDLTFEEIVAMRSVADIKRVLAARGVEVLS